MVRKERHTTEHPLLLGCVADDFTGASDMASFLAAGGLKTLLTDGIPDEEHVLEEAPQAIVIALKSRTAETQKAVKNAREGFAWLKQHGAKQLYFKYCSTFDSTKEGNIGPVIDAVLEEYRLPYTIVCPALPINGRVVFNGYLFVNHVPLHESPMKAHPLTPMWDSHVGRLLSEQGKYESYHVMYQSLEAGKENVLEDIETFTALSQKTPFYVVVDFFREEHATDIVNVFGDFPFLTGGSGLATSLAAHHTQHKHFHHPLQWDENVTSGPTHGGLILAGSCSVATQQQVAAFIEHGGTALKIEPVELLHGEQTKEGILDFISTHNEEDVLVYSSDTRENVLKSQEAGREAISKLLEETMAYLASETEKHGRERIIVAGGETSGAVIKALGFRSYWIGESVTPGVPLMVPVVKKQVRLVLKSGNFGQPDFFEKALHVTKGGYDESEMSCNV